MCVCKLVCVFALFVCVCLHVCAMIVTCKFVCVSFLFVSQRVFVCVLECDVCELVCVFV